MKNENLKEVGRVFLKLGLISFGGPPVHMALMESEIVRKRQWFSHQHFLDIIGATNLIPGPNSVEIAMHCGQERAGWRGLILAGLCFISPAVFITAAIAYVYQLYGNLPAADRFMYGVKPAIIAVIISAMYALGKKAMKNVELGILGILVFVGCAMGMNKIAALFGAGFLGIFIYWLRTNVRTVKTFIPLFLQTPNGAAGISQLKIFWLFLKAGGLIYGSGYVLFAFFETELVSKGLFPKRELIDAIAIGQFTPGPVFSSATFIGWQMAGWKGAVVASVAIFLPSFFYVAFLNPFIPKLRNSKVMSAFLDAVNIAAVALILAICLDLIKFSVTDWRTIIIAVLCLAVSLTFKKLNGAIIVISGGVLGYILLGF